MEIFRTQEELKSYLNEHRTSNKKVALVPTMGALHQGHLSLIKAAKTKADITVCSIFVNPTQFNDPKDLEKYPRPIDRDIELLTSHNCDILFLPSVEEMYPSKDESWNLPLGQLDLIWEGKNRPGHFQGVTQIVYKLFNLVEPDIAYFGQKDFQQVMVIQKMVELKNLPIEIITYPIVRDENGLALSSRNTRLSQNGKQIALTLFKSLNFTKNNLYNLPLKELKKEAEKILTSEKEIELEYFAICEARSLEETKALEPNKKYVALVVALVEGVRLIDNMLLN